MYKKILIIMTSLYLIPSSYANRCDQIAVMAMSKRHNEECKGKAPSPFCNDLERDINNYLTFFYSKDKAGCLRIHAKYNIEVLDPIDRNPDRLFRPHNNN